MRSGSRLLALAFCFGLFLAAGCARNKDLRNQVSMLQNQVVALTDEVANLSDNQTALERSLRSAEDRTQLQSTRQTRALIPGPARTGGASKSASGQVTVNNGVYRTPSGFEMPLRQIQAALQNAGYYQGNVDGKLGPVTEEAVRRFQNDNGLETDGIVGRNTWARLKEFA
ncbi:MAG: peptidoglycan-binding protein [Candidatus Omnitrophica bacterium]|nr:peptidoglycan-binding protein [Candidatus Omnitrophota bacterium]